MAAGFSIPAAAGRSVRADMGRIVDSDDLWNSKAVGRYLGLGSHDDSGAAGARAVSVYRLKYADFPTPLYEDPNAVLWVRQDIEEWRAKHPPRKHPPRRRSGS